MTITNNHCEPSKGEKNGGKKKIVLVKGRVGVEKRQERMSWKLVCFIITEVAVVLSVGRGAGKVRLE